MVSEAAPADDTITTFNAEWSCTSVAMNAFEITTEASLESYDISGHDPYAPKSFLKQVEGYKAIFRRYVGTFQYSIAGVIDSEIPK